MYLFGSRIAMPMYLFTFRCDRKHLARHLLSPFHVDAHEMIMCDMSLIHDIGDVYVSV